MRKTSKGDDGPLGCPPASSILCSRFWRCAPSLRAEAGTVYCPMLVCMYVHTHVCTYIHAEQRRSGCIMACLIRRWGPVAAPHERSCPQQQGAVTWAVRGWKAARGWGAGPRWQPPPRQRIDTGHRLDSERKVGGGREGQGAWWRGPPPPPSGRRQHRPAAARRSRHLDAGATLAPPLCRRGRGGCLQRAGPTSESCFERAQPPALTSADCGAVACRR